MSDDELDDIVLSELNDDELKLLDEVFTDSINIAETGRVRRAIKLLRSHKYLIEDVDGKVQS